jgi:hypothetical protein
VIIFKSKFLEILTLVSIMMTSMSVAASAQDIQDEALRIGETEFFVNEILDLVFDQRADYREILDCNTVLMEQKNDDGGVNAACVTSSNVLWVSTRMTINNQIGSVYVCPVNQSQSSVDRLIELSFETKPLSNGEIHNLGYTDGWRRNYVHRLAMLNFDGGVLGCWDIARR